MIYAVDKAPLFMLKDIYLSWLPEKGHD